MKEEKRKLINFQKPVRKNGTMATIIKHLNEGSTMMIKEAFKGMAFGMGVIGVYALLMTLSGANDDEVTDFIEEAEDDDIEEDNSESDSDDDSDEED